VPSTPIRREPRFDASVDSEALMGEGVLVFEETIEGWAWIQLETDGYVGYVASEALAPPSPLPTHRVTALRTFLYPGPDMKLPPLAALSLGAKVAIASEAETRGTRFSLLAGGAGALVSRHVAPLEARAETDFVTVAERFLHVPYLWGGRTSLGIDCSGLVQLALAETGVVAPRDSDQQAAGLGEALDPADPTSLRRGDLVAWKGHIGMMQDANTLLHASGYHMEVVSESFGVALGRIAASSGAPIAIRRMP
jgi:cell wall-associated NlpC family hydrolase